MTKRLLSSGVLAMAVASLAVACSKSSTSPSGGGSNAGCTASSTSTTITISGNAVCPQNVTVPPGTQVTFVNQDSRVHTMNSDPHPEHTDCPEINQVGRLEPGQSRQTGNLNTVRRCGIHDHDNPLVTALQGSITIR